jgi:hypothetical protein
LRHRQALRDVVREVISGAVRKKEATAHVRKWAEERIGSAERDRFREVAESELVGLHDGNATRYQVRPSEFARWRRRGEKER